VKILVIPEDFRKDQYILEPIIRAMVQWCGVPNPRVEVCRDPLLGGVREAMSVNLLEEIVSRYPMVDLFILCVDRDGDEARRSGLDRIEREIENALGPGQRFVSEAAWQELEVWVLAGLKDMPQDWEWRAIRRERDPKERYFEPMARRRDLDRTDDGGRKSLAREAARRYKRVRQLCPEDIQALERRILPDE
jgi:hypothetical protein